MRGLVFDRVSPEYAAIFQDQPVLARHLGPRLLRTFGWNLRWNLRRRNLWGRLEWRGRHELPRTRRPNVVFKAVNALSPRHHGAPVRSAESQWVFPGHKETHLVDVKNAHKAVLKRSHLSFVLYDLRHTFAIRFAEVTGGDVVALAKISAIPTSAPSCATSASARPTPEPRWPASPRAAPKCRDPEDTDEK
jgi:hypothetical protein